MPTMRHRVTARRALYSIGLVLVLASTILAGCAPQAAATLPAATVVTQPTLQPPPQPAVQPVTQSMPTLAPPQAPTQAPSPTAQPAAPANNPIAKDGLQVTVLHTNDVNGEIDPCG